MKGVSCYVMMKNFQHALSVNFLPNIKPTFPVSLPGKNYDGNLAF